MKTKKDYNYYLLGVVGVILVLTMASFSVIPPMVFISGLGWIYSLFATITVISFIFLVILRYRKVPSFRQVINMIFTDSNLPKRLKSNRIVINVDDTTLCNKIRNIKASATKIFKLIGFSFVVLFLITFLTQLLILSPSTGPGLIIIANISYNNAPYLLYRVVLTITKSIFVSLLASGAYIIVSLLILIFQFVLGLKLTAFGKSFKVIQQCDSKKYLYPGILTIIASFINAFYLICLIIVNYFRYKNSLTLLTVSKIDLIFSIVNALVSFFAIISYGIYFYIVSSKEIASNVVAYRIMLGITLLFLLFGYSSLLDSSIQNLHLIKLMYLNGKLFKFGIGPFAFLMEFSSFFDSLFISFLFLSFGYIVLSKVFESVLFKFGNS